VGRDVERWPAGFRRQGGEAGHAVVLCSLLRALLSCLPPGIIHGCHPGIRYLHHIQQPSYMEQQLPHLDD